MIRLFIGLVLSIPALVGAAYATAWSVARPPKPNWPRTIVILIAFVIALMALLPPYYFYKGALCLALLILIFGDAMMLVEGTPVTIHAGVNVIVYFLLWLAFSITAGRMLWTLPGMWGLIPLALAAALYFLAFYPHLGELRVPVGIYAINAALVVAMATSLYAVKTAPWSLVALVGAILFVAPDVIAGWHAWRSPIPRMAIFWTLCLLLGVLLLGWSTWGDGLSRFADLLHLFG